ncbi:hypothetical protein APUTEX25_004021, partial [Auxenochlorella protothecoides]
NELRKLGDERRAERAGRIRAEPLLVESARASLTLRPGLAPEFLQGLEQYTHCWVLYVFHRNTDLQRLWGGSDRGLRAKIRVPRLDGGRLGALATRSPHRPCPIGLSVARVLRVSGRTLLLGGADVVDGSPVLDVKPYALDLTPLTPGGEAAGFWRVALDGVEVAYDVVQEGSEAGGRPVVIVRGGRAWTAAAGEGDEEAWADDVDRAPVAPE